MNDDEIKNLKDTFTSEIEQLRSHISHLEAHRDELQKQLKKTEEALATCRELREYDRNERR